MQHPAANTGSRLSRPVQALLEWHHKRRWSRRNIARLRSADAVVVSHTKSGRTWLRVMISHLYHIKYGIPASEIIVFDNLHAMNPAIPRIYFTRDTLVPTFSRSGGNVHVDRDKRVLFLIRDPRDAAVSFYYHVRNRASDRELIRKGISLQSRSMELYDFMVDDSLGVARVIGHYNRWRDEMQHLQHTLVVRYEEMRENPVDTLDRIVTFLDRSFDREDVIRATSFASFESLSHKEKTGFFTTGRLGSSNPGNAGSYKVRRGKVGGYRDYFTEEQNRQIDDMVNTQLDPFFGYS